MQDRWVSYIYRYVDGRKCENAGYIKLIRTSREGQDLARLDIGLKLFKPMVCRCRIYLIYNQKELVLADELLVKPEERDVIAYKKIFSWRNFLREGVTPRDYDGVFFAVDDGDVLMSLWNDNNIDIGKLSIADTDDGKGNSSDSVVEDCDISEAPSGIGLIPMPDYLKQIDKHKVNEEVKEEKNSGNILEENLKPRELEERKSEQDALEHIMETHVKLPIFIDSPFLQCVKMVPQDIGKLPISNWKLGQNSFLTHGYYRYKYIMLGKIQLDNKNREIYVIGVPGVYTNKERYLANMFGFNLFVPVKKSDTKTGCFGYWVWEVVRE